MKLQKYFIFFLLLSFLNLSYAQEKLRVVVTFSILADFTKIIGKDCIEVISIVPTNSDPHIYQPTPETVQQISRADLIILNGLGFEGWIERLLESTKYQGKVIVATKGIKPRYLFDPAFSQSARVSDPHAWHDVHNAMVYVKNICTALQEFDPPHALLYQDSTQDYLTKLSQLENWIQKQLMIFPFNQRRIISAHDAFGYFADRYHITLYSLQGISTETEPSAKQVADLIRTIKKEHIHALFTENSTNSSLIQQVADETHIRIGGMLYSDSLSGAEGPAATYIDLMSHNVSTIVSALNNPLLKETR